MKRIRFILVSLVTLTALTSLSPTFIYAVDAARVAGDLKVDGLYFSGDPNRTVLTKPADFQYPWSYVAPNVYFGLQSGNVGIGTASPTAKLDVNGDANFVGNINISKGSTAQIGTNDNSALEIVANGIRALRIVPDVTSPNIALGSPTNIAGGVNVSGATVSGGGNAGLNCYNVISNDYDLNCANIASNRYATVGGGLSNTASGLYATVSGGEANTASGDEATIAGGNLNTASYSYASIGGGYRNTASSFSSTVGGGDSNTASGWHSTVGGGDYNTASGDESIIGGGYDNTASGQFATVCGGRSNTASGNTSFAAGYHAKTQTSAATPVVHNGVFIFSDHNNFDFNSVTANEFAVRATGGVRFVTGINASGTPTRTFQVDSGGNVTANGNITATGVVSAASVSSTGFVNIDNSALNFGATARQMINLWNESYAIGVQSFTQYFRSEADFAWFKGGVHSNAGADPGAGGSILMKLTSGGLYLNGSLIPLSDRNKKENFEEIDSRQILEKVANLPIQLWNYKDDDNKVRHIGPMAQDFYAAFNVGPDDKHIATVDSDGVALAAIKALKAENDELKKRLEKVEKLLTYIKGVN